LIPKPEVLSLDALSDVALSVERYRFDDRLDVLVLKFAGTYRHGSAGNPDATAMFARARSALAAWHPDALVFDFRALDYRWGDGMLRVVGIESDFPDTPLPTVVAAGEGSRAGLSSLLTKSSLFDELELAIAEAHRRAAELDALETEHELSLKMYILIRDSVAPGFATLGAAHAGVAAMERFEGRWELRLWITGLFRKVVCRVDDEQFEKAKSLADNVVITESALDGQEVAIALMPRPELPGWVRHLPLYR